MAYRDIPIVSVDITSPFWANVQRRAREKTIPAILEAQKSAKHWECLTWKRDNPIKPHPFWDSDVYKWTEATCNFLLKHPDPKMREAVDEAVEMIQKAQHEDGYLNSYYTVRGIENRWTNLRDMHELYCLGHLIEATVAYETLTGTGKLLEVVMKAIRHVDSIFGSESGKKRGYPGHEEIEIGLLRLHEMTGDPLPLKLARYFILERGQRDENDEIYFDHEARARGGDPYDHMGSEMKHHHREPRDYGYGQADCPIQKATEVKGHSVRAMYYYTAVTDLYRLSSEGDAEVREAQTALDGLWRDLVDKKMYITGGIGSVSQWEGFGPPYVLPDLECEGCYSETCATFAMINWCQRLLRINLDAEYADIMEVGLYNAFLGAVSVEGDAFYYTNVLRTEHGEKKERSKWFGVACCPPNVAKLLGAMGSLIYSYQPSKTRCEVAIHLYIGSELKVPGTDIKVTMTTNMPWSGEVSIRVSGDVDLALRIPGWAKDQNWSCSSEGQLDNGYYSLKAKKGEEIKLTLPMKAQRVYAHPDTNKDEIALMRGPLVYCLEDADNGDADVDHIGLLDVDVTEDAPMQIGPVDGIVPIVATAKKLATNPEKLYGSQPWKYATETKKVKAIPYFLRANRGGEGAMRVWTKRLEARS